MKRRVIQKPEDWGLLKNKDPKSWISIVGPTGAGKTALAMELAQKLLPAKTLILSLDSVAAYTGLDVGSAKPTAAQREEWDFLGLDLFDPSESVNARGFLEKVSTPLLNAVNEGRPIILVGGSHFYERALVEGMSPGAASDPEFVSSLEPFSGEELRARLLRQAPELEEKLYAGDRYRLIRYLDLVERQKISLDRIQNERVFPVAINGRGLICDTLILGLEEALPKEEQLRKRIDGMLDAGWIEEVQSLVKSHSSEAPALQTVGYREIVDSLKHVMDEALPRDREAMKLLKEKVLISHRQLGKKQRTWIRGLLRRLQAE